VLHAALVCGSFVVPTPVFLAYFPGPLRDVESLIHVTGAAI